MVQLFEEQACSFLMDTSRIHGMAVQAARVKAARNFCGTQQSNCGPSRRDKESLKKFACLDKLSMNGQSLTFSIPHRSVRLSSVER